MNRIQILKVDMRGGYPKKIAQNGSRKITKKILMMPRNNSNSPALFAKKAGLFYLSGQGESNSHLLLGKQPYCHYTMPALIWRLFFLRSNGGHWKIPKYWRKIFYFSTSYQSFHFCFEDFSGEFLRPPVDVKLNF